MITEKDGTVRFPTYDEAWADPDKFFPTYLLGWIVTFKNGKIVKIQDSTITVVV